MSHPKAKVIEKEIQHTRSEIVENVSDLGASQSNIDGQRVLQAVFRVGKDAALTEIEQATRRAGDKLAVSTRSMTEKSKQYPLVLAGVGLLAGYLLTTYNNSKGHTNEKPR